MPTKLSSIDLCDVAPVSLFIDERGSLSVHQTARFRRFRRAFWLHSVPMGTSRGNHSLRKTTQTFIAIQGSVVITLEDAEGDYCKIDLRAQDDAVIVPPNIWRTLDSFSEDAIIMVLCDTPFDESEYVENKITWRVELGQ